MQQVNKKQETRRNNKMERIYDLKERTFEFALNVRKLINKLPRSYSNLKDGKQVIRSSGSVGANYIEANDPLGSKDEIMHLKIARKEARESSYWLKLLKESNKTILQDELAYLIDESEQLKTILSSIINKIQSRNKNQVSK